MMDNFRAADHLTEREVHQANRRSIANGHSGMRKESHDNEHAPADAQFGNTCQARPATISDKRECPRDPAQDLSEILIPGQKHGIACMIRDISASGARLEVSCSELPPRFVLANYTRRTKIICRQIWRKNRLVGVKFLSKPRAFSLDERI